MTVIICGSSRAKTILVIAQEVVPLHVFYKRLEYYRFEEFADATKVLNGSMLHECSPTFLKIGDTVDTFHRFGKHIFFKQGLNSIPSNGDNTGLKPLRFCMNLCYSDIFNIRYTSWGVSILISFSNLSLWIFILHLVCHLHSVIRVSFIINNIFADNKSVLLLWVCSKLT